MLRVSLRTLQNWLSGRHQVPYSVYKLLRLMRYMELPGQAWAGWHFSRGQLVTPEGRVISGKDGSWWSLLVRQAHHFGALYRDSLALRKQLMIAKVESGGVADALALAGLVTSKTRVFSESVPNNPWGQDGAIIEPWPTISDYPMLSMPTLDNAVSASVSALTPCSASPSMPTSGSPAQPLQSLPAPFMPSRHLPLPMSLRHQRHQEIYPASLRDSSAGNSQPPSDTPTSTNLVHGGAL